MDAAQFKTIKGRTPLRASSAIRSAIRQRGKKPGSLNFTYCPKIGRDFVFPSDLEFLHALHLEADETIAGYEPDPEKIIERLGEDGIACSKPDAITVAHNQRVCMVEVKYKEDLEKDLRAQLQVQVQRQAASKAGMDWRVYTDEDAQAEERLLNDWLHIVVMLGHCRGKVSKALTQAVNTASRDHGRLNLAEIRGLQIDDWYLVFAAIFQLVQKGALSTNLGEAPLSRSTEVWQSGR